MGKQFVGPSNKLMELKKLRTWADYHASQKLNMAGEVQKALAHTKWIIEKLQ
jgi:hypothetical protein